MFSLIKRCAPAMLLVLVSAPAWAANEGQDDLDKATDVKLVAKTISDLGEVIRLTESALDKGLDASNTEFANRLLAATLMQRAQETTKHMATGVRSPADFRQQRQFALSDLEKAVNLDSKQPEAYMLMAQLHLAPGGDVKLALEAVDKALQLGLDEPSARVKALLLRAGLEERPERKLADVEASLALDPDNATALRFRAMLLAERQRYDEAIAELEKLKKLDPKNTLTLLQMAVTYSAQKKPAKAIETYSALLAEDSTEWRALRGRGDAFLVVGKQAEALADYQRALALQPKDYGVLNNLAWVLATSPEEKLRDGRRAIELATKACELTEYKQAHILSTLAAAYAETGDFDSAVKWSSKAVDMGDKEHGDALKKELESYRAKKPWRELLGDNASAEKKSDDTPAEKTTDKP